MSATASTIAVVHIVLREFGLEPFRSFIRSYRAHPPGIAHDLILAFKGFSGETDLEPYRRELDGIAYLHYQPKEGGFDLGTYFQAARDFDHTYFCFLNSRSILLADDWLAKFHRGASREDVGIVGATGSYQSLSTDALGADRKPAFSESWLRGVARRLLINYLWLLVLYPSFPNAHVRTNAFMMKRDLLLEIARGKLVSRRDTSCLESGRRSISRQLLEKGLRVLLVDSQGNCHPPADWRNLRLFWQQGQEDLIVGDNQTAAYSTESKPGRAARALRAWGG